MQYRFKDVVDSLEFNELSRMKEDIQAGGFNLLGLLDKKLKDRAYEHENNCSHCLSPIHAYSTNNYCLTFGPMDFRKKATFCGIDCMEFFLRELKNIKRVINQ